MHTLLDLNGDEIVHSTQGSRQPITELIADSRRVTPGSAFFAIPGIRTNGMSM